MAELVEDIAQYLVDNGLAQGLAQDVFLDCRPDQPDKVISLFDTGGYPAEIGLSDLKRTVQVSVRGTAEAGGAADAKSAIWRLFNLLERPEARTHQMGSRRAIIRAMQPPMSIGPDENGRPIWAFNLSIWTLHDEE